MSTEPSNFDESLLSPYLAALEGRDAASQQAFFEKFARQSEEVRQFITSMDTFTAVKNLVDSGIVPAQYGVAIAKIIAFVALDEVPAQQVPTLLSRLGMTEEQARAASDSTQKILAPMLAARSRPTLVAPPAMPELPPLNRPTENGPRPIIGASGGARNIIDLRRQNPQ